MSTSMQSAMRLRHFPASFFAMIMGLAGSTIAWEKAPQVMQVELGIAPWVLAASLVLFVLVAGVYASKLVRHPDAVIAELNHPVRLNFVPTASISLLLLSVALLPRMPAAAAAFWALGAASQLGFTLHIVGRWMHDDRFQLHHLNPSWFIPAVGNVLVPIAGVPLGFPAVSWFFFSAGVLLWSVLLIIVFYRVLFHQPLDERLMPTLFILVAPPAAGFIAYLQLLFHRSVPDAAAVRAGAALPAPALLSLVVGLLLPARRGQHRLHGDAPADRRGLPPLSRHRAVDDAQRHRPAAAGRDRHRSAAAARLRAGAMSRSPSR
jgi:tellurite resistance protein